MWILNNDIKTNKILWFILPEECRRIFFQAYTLNVILIWYNILLKQIFFAWVETSCYVKIRVLLVDYYVINHCYNSAGARAVASLPRRWPQGLPPPLGHGVLLPTWGVCVGWTEAHSPAWGYLICFYTHWERLGWV